MPIYLIERNFAEQLEVTPEGAAAINLINDEQSVRWLISFLSVDKKKTFCLYEASSAEAIVEAARRAGIPADTIIEVGEEIVPSGETNPLKYRTLRPGIVQRLKSAITSDFRHQGVFTLCGEGGCLLNSTEDNLVV